MAISTIDTYLMLKAACTVNTVVWERLIDITEFPDLGAAPDTIDVTSLSDDKQKNVEGVQKLDNLEFGAHFDLSSYERLQELAEAGDVQKLAVLFGTDASGEPDGHNGIVAFAGQLSVYIKGGKANEVVGIGITVACSETPELAESLDWAADASATAYSPSMGSWTSALGGALASVPLA